MIDKAIKYLFAAYVIFAVIFSGYLNFKSAQRLHQNSISVLEDPLTMLKGAIWPYFVIAKVIKSNATKKKIIDNVQNIAEAASVIDVCFLSPEYKLLKADDALKIGSLLIRMNTLVNTMSKTAEDDKLFAVFTAYHTKLSENSKLKEEVKAHFNNCGPNLYSEMNPWLTQAEDSISVYAAE